MADLKNDIEKYLHGELSPEDRHALEKRALSDPFLADALEGGESLPPEDFASDLRMLEASLQERIQKKDSKVLPLWVWPARIAAGLLLLAVTIFVINSLLRQDPAPRLAKNKSKNTVPAPPEKPVVTEDSVNPAAKDASRQPEQIDIEEERTTDGFLSLAEPEEAKPSAPPAEKRATESLASGATRPNEVQQQAPDAVAGEGAKDDGKLDEKVVFEEEVAQSEVSPSAVLKQKSEPGEKAGLADESKRSSKVARRLAVPSQTLADSSVAYNALSNSGRLIRGQVTSADDGKGLPGVNVIIIGTNEGTVTNAEGYYQLAVKDEETGLLFSFIGMENLEVTPDATDEVNVAMNADMTQLSEVVVVGYGSEKVSEDVPKTFEFAVPEGGRAAYKQYLETNLRYPELALENNVEGRVTIQFTVETTGQLSNFRVLKGIGSGCDEEVIRLIRRGPKWIPTKRDEVAIRDKVKVRVRFRAPKK